MKITQNIVSRADALKISADYVAFVEGDFDKFNDGSGYAWPTKG